MKKAIIFIVLIGFLVSASNVLAAFPNDLPGPKISPDSKLYFLKIWWEKLVIFFTFDAEKRAERYQAFAEKRVAEAKEMLSKGNVTLAEKLKGVYESYLNKAKDALNKAIQKAIDKQKEALRQRLEQELDELMEKIKDSLTI